MFGEKDPPELVADALMYRACFSDDEQMRSTANNLWARMQHPSFKETRTLGPLDPEKLCFLADCLKTYEQALPDRKSIAEAARMRNIVRNGLDILADRIVDACQMPDCPKDLISGS